MSEKKPRKPSDYLKDLNPYAEEHYRIERKLDALIKYLDEQSEESK